MITRKILLTILLLSLPIITTAKSLPLIESCHELVKIYKTHDKKALLAAQTTSLSESLRAGYCLGVLKEYSIQTPYPYCRSDWFKRATFIAKYLSEQSPPNERKLLELSCGI